MIFRIVHPEVKLHMREKLVDWLFIVARLLHMTTSSLHLTVKLIDRLLVSNKVKMERYNFQAYGMMCAYIANKILDTTQPLLDDFVYMCKNTYSKSYLKELEVTILKALNFDVMGIYHAIDVYTHRYKDNYKTKEWVHFLLDFTILDVELFHCVAHHTLIQTARGLEHFGSANTTISKSYPGFCPRVAKVLRHKLRVAFKGNEVPEIFLKHGSCTTTPQFESILLESKTEHGDTSCPVDLI